MSDSPTAAVAEEPFDAVVTLVSDRGPDGEWVGVVHSILAQMAPGRVVVDLTHRLPPDDVRAAALALARSVQYIAPGVVVVAVGDDLDPAVELVAVSAAGGRAVFVGPDNGVLAPAVAMVGGAESAVRLDNTDVHLESPGGRDPGRDVLVPVAAHLACGVEVTDVGTPLDPNRLRPGLLPLSTTEPDGRISAEALSVGHRGAVQLNVEPDDIAAWPVAVTVEVNGADRVARRVGHVSELAPGGLGLVVDAHGMIAVVASGASAAEDLGVEAGDQLALRPSADTEGAEGPGAVPVHLGRPSDAGRTAPTINEEGR